MQLVSLAMMAVAIDAKAIRKACENRFGVPIDKRRTKLRVMAKGAAYILCRDLLNHSKTDTAIEFDCDYSTVLHLLRKFANDPEMRTHVDQIKDQLGVRYKTTSSVEQHART